VFERETQIAWSVICDIWADEHTICLAV